MASDHNSWIIPLKWKVISQDKRRLQAIIKEAEFFMIVRVWRLFPFKALTGYTKLSNNRDFLKIKPNEMCLSYTGRCSLIYRLNSPTPPPPEYLDLSFALQETPEQDWRPDQVLPEDFYVG